MIILLDYILTWFFSIFSGLKLQLTTIFETPENGWWCQAIRCFLAHDDDLDSDAGVRKHRLRMKVAKGRFNCFNPQSNAILLLDLLSKSKWLFFNIPNNYHLCWLIIPFNFNICQGLVEHPTVGHQRLSQRAICAYDFYAARAGVWPDEIVSKSCGVRGEKSWLIQKGLMSWGPKRADILAT